LLHHNEFCGVVISPLLLTTAPD